MSSHRSVSKDEIPVPVQVAVDPLDETDETDEIDDVTDADADEIVAEVEVPAEPRKSRRPRREAEQPREGETPLDFPREWIEFYDPDNPEHLIRADLTWLLSRWTCIFGKGCHGIQPGGAAQGCCSHGAFFTDEDDERRVRAAAKTLTPLTWQHYRRGFSQYTEMDTVDGKTPARRTATRPDGPCVFLNDADFRDAPGCALHAAALRHGIHPLKYKPDVCWQLPVRRDQEWTTRPDGSKILQTVLAEFDRRGWGEGGHDLHWWCTSSPEAHVGGEAMYVSYGPELAALVGQAAYDRLAEICATREKQGLVLIHPATVAASGGAAEAKPASKPKPAKKA
jgi:hypothetical protein